MKTLLKKLDIFGQPFQFTIYKEEKFSTIFGGAMSALFMILVLLTIAFLARDFYLRENPRSNQEVVDNIVEPEPFPVKSENLSVCWRFMINDTIRTNENDYIYMNINFTDWFVNKERRKVRSIQVNETSLLNNTDFFWSKYWWTMDLDFNYTFGGSIFTDTIDWYTFAVSSCPDKELYPGRSCTPLSVLKDYLKYTKFTVEFLYPSYNYNSKSPQHLQWIRHIVPISLGLSRFDTYYLRNVSVMDDVGWAGNEVYETKYLSIYNRDSSFAFTPVNELHENENFLFYNIELYLDRTKLVYSRSFMKIQDVLSQIGGIISATVIIFKMITLDYNGFERNVFLSNEVFENTNNGPSRLMNK
jgi:hypothetical protein